MKYECSARIGNKSIMLSTLQTDESRTKGYQGCDKVPSEYEGALFIFDDEAPRTFHMKNVSFDLDLLGFNSENRLVFVMPMDASAEKKYHTFPCKYAVEVKKGWANDLPIGAARLSWGI